MTMKPTQPGKATQSAAASVVVYGCDQKPVTRPAQFTLACGDGTITLSSLTWSNWGQPTATATGTYSLVVCVPSCATGTEVHVGATVTVSGLRGGSYTVMHINAPNAPNAYTPTMDYTLSSAGPAVKN
jgi:hypothetical protein